MRIYNQRIDGLINTLNHVTYLKLGGSLITEKRQAESPRLDILARLAAEIAEAQRENPMLRLLLGHGSGSFGHVVGKRYGTRAGVVTAEQWVGFAATHDAAARLNRLVTGALLNAGVPAWSIQPSVALRCVDGKIIAGPEDTVQQALRAGLTPLVYGDVALDTQRGGTIASTEEIFDWLIESIPPKRIVLVGEVDGVYTADPQNNPLATRIPLITSANFAQISEHLGGSHGVDVTGGMIAKVQQSLAMTQRFRNLEVIICSGLIDGNLRSALTDAEVQVGTVIRYG